MNILNQRGFSLIEVSIVTAIILLIAVIGIPTIGNYVMENRVPKVAEELARFIVQMKVNAGASGDAPYTDISNDNLNSLVDDSSVLNKNGSGSILHGLGENGTVSLAKLDNGDGFSVTLSNVNHIACPSIASILQRVATEISVNNGSTSKTIKDVDTQYSALSAESGCNKGNVNKFVFSIY